MPEGREFELKFAIEPSACEALVSHPALRQALAGRQLSHLASTYFDTADERLRRERVSLRVRKGDNGAVQTVKQVTGSIVDRGEWERPVEGSQPDLDFLLGTPLKPLFETIDDGLEPRFTVDVTRTTFPLRRGRAGIEAALDRGAIRAEGRAVEISELELESKEGRPAAVLDMARDLVRDLPLNLSLASKAERGYAVAGLTWGRPVKGLDLALTADMTRAEAFAAIVQACLAAITWNAMLIRGEDDGDAIHKTRIALRRLRAALAIFKPTLRRRRLKGVSRDLRWAAHKLGVARDADVLQAEHFEPATRDPHITGASDLVAVMARDRSRAHADVRDALGSPRWRLLLVELLAYSQDGIRRSHRRRSFLGFIRRRLVREHKRVRRGAARLSRLRSQRRHDLRKAAKMLRYDLEMFQSVPKLGGAKKTYVALLESLETMQETLGALQDRAAARAHLARVVLDRPRPADVPPEVWRSATSAARALSAAEAGHGQALGKANKAARRLRRPVSFR